MPYYISNKHPNCKSGWATVNSAYEVKGCHKTKDEAIKQMVAISRAEEMEPGGTHPRDRKKESVNLKEFSTDLYMQVEGDEKALVDGIIAIVEEFGKFESEGSSVNVGYDGPATNPNRDIGVICGNCVFHVETEDGIECTVADIDIEEEGACRFAMIPPGLVMVPSEMNEAAPGALRVGDFVRWNSSGGTSQGQISRIVRNGSIKVPDSTFTITGTEDDPAALITVWRKSGDKWQATSTKVGHKFSTLSKTPSLRESLKLTEAAAAYKVPAGVQSAAKRAQKWISDGLAGDGFTSTGRRRASQLAAGGTVTRDTIARMKSYFARHAVDKKATGFNAGEKGYPSAGRVAWDAWGGDAGRTWVNRISLD